MHREILRYIPASQPRQLLPIDSAAVKICRICKNLQAQETYLGAGTRAYKALLDFGIHSSRGHSHGDDVHVDLQRNAEQDASGKHSHHM